MRHEAKLTSQIYAALCKNWLLGDIIIKNNNIINNRNNNNNYIYLQDKYVLLGGMQGCAERVEPVRECACSVESLRISFIVGINC